MVVGFGPPVLDPEATRARARSVVSTSPEARKVLTLLRDLRTSGKLSTEDAQILTDARTVLAKKISEESRARPIYFDTIPNEINVPGEVAADLKNLFNRRPPFSALLLDGSVIPDHRGRAFWFRHATEGFWVSDVVNALGANKPGFSAWVEDLKPSELAEICEQKENDRLANLTPDEKAVEKSAALLSARRAAASMRSDMEIEGNERALETARLWYQEQVKSIQEKFR